MTNDRTAFGTATRAACARPLAWALACVTGACVACSGSQASGKGAATPSSSASSSSSTPAVASAPSATPTAPEETAPAASQANGTSQETPAIPPSPADSAAQDEAQHADEKDAAELVVSRDVVSRCPEMRMVRQNAARFDPDMLWVAVLVSLADCMKGGPMALQTIGVSGDEEHRHVVREVLGSRGVAPTRVVAVPLSAQGRAECQGGIDCSQRVEITIAPSAPAAPAR
jgi:hypothetical protein